MMIYAVMAVLLCVLSTQPATPISEPNVFIDLGAEHCTEEIAIAAYENTRGAGVTTRVSPVYATYSAFAFGSADLARAALDDLPRLVAETYMDDEVDTDLDELMTEVPTDDAGDEWITYLMTLPVDDDELNVLFVDMLAAVRGSQLVLILLFDHATSSQPSSGLGTEAILPPFTEAIEEDWTGHGDLEEAIPEEDEMPPGWVGQDITTGELPPCEQLEQ